MFPGLEIKIDGESYTVPALSLGQLRNGGAELLKKHDEIMNSGQNIDVLIARGEIIHLAMTRNHPNLRRETLDAYLDMGNTTDVWLAVMGLTGFKPGEAPAAPTSQDGTSGLSTAS